MSNPWLTGDCSSLLFYKSLGVLALSNPCVSRDSSSLMISESLGAFCAIESMRHP
jgi:hypothetical protein